jgi:hypothetical protein
MPAVTIWVFAVGGAALAGRMSKKPPPAMGDRGRIPIAASLLVVAVTPALLMLSQYKLQSSADAFENGTCRTAVDDAMSSINVLGNRAQPYQIVGYCNIENGRPQDGVAAFKKAVEQEPRGWEYHYGLALARGASGLDPKPELAVAARLNPREPMIAQARTALASADPTQWESEATKLAADARVSGRLSLR